MALNKSKRWDALALHVMAYVPALMLALGLLRVEFRLETPWLFLGVNAVAHFVQDAITSRLTSRLWPFPKVGEGMRPNWIQVEVKNTRHWFFVAIGADQLLHYVTLFVTAGWWLQ
jgi:hypothetical protein